MNMHLFIIRSNKKQNYREILKDLFQQIGP